jgi:hypothetical protein
MIRNYLEIMWLVSIIKPLAVLSESLGNETLNARAEPIVSNQDRDDENPVVQKYRILFFGCAFVVASAIGTLFFVCMDAILTTLIFKYSI